MQIFVKTFTGKTIELNAEPLDLIEDIKAKFQEEEGVPIEQQLLFLNEFFDEEPLEDNRLLSYYNIQNGSTLKMRYILKSHEYIYVKMPSGKLTILRAGPSDLIENVKVEIQDKEGVSKERQTLFFAGRKLEDGHILSDYNIVYGTLFLRID